MLFDKERTAGNLKAIRNMRGLTQQELAERSHVSRESITGYENAENVMSLEAATKLADALDCSIDSFVAEIEV